MPCYHKIPAVQVAPGAQLTFPKFSLTENLDVQKKRFAERVQSQKPGVFPRLLMVPCKQCIGCRLDFAHTWAVRCILEQKYSIPDSCYFLTLTYDDISVPKSIGSDVDIQTGEVSRFFETLTLDYRDVALFMKRLRQNLYRRYHCENLRVFYCGEYGSKTSRPHYHFILFNFDVPRYDLHLCENTSQGGFPLYESDVITDSWQKGLHCLGLLSYNSACYTAGYMIDKKKGQDSVLYDKLGIVPPKSFQSRRPGLARQFYEDNKDFVYVNDCLGVSVGSKSISPAPPHYFDSLYVQEHGENSLDHIKFERLQNSIISDKKLQEALNMPIDMYWSKKYDVVLENVTRGKSKFL